ncbi:hypothetical protein BC827DRAFT_581869 [Russula dissimulans]|nr:hypothetical protein BC827DRAFT_581869 [Russula dissimulans]
MQSSCASLPSSNTPSPPLTSETRLWWTVGTVGKHAATFCRGHLRKSRSPASVAPWRRRLVKGHGPVLQYQVQSSKDTTLARHRHQRTRSYPIQLQGYYSTTNDDITGDMASPKLPASPHVSTTSTISEGCLQQRVTNSFLPGPPRPSGSRRQPRGGVEYAPPAHRLIGGGIMIRTRPSVLTDSGRRAPPRAGADHDRDRGEPDLVDWRAIIADVLHRWQLAWRVQTNPLTLAVTIDILSATCAVL